MQAGNQLGIYLRKDRATVVCLAGQGRDRKLLDCFSVRTEADESDAKVLYDRIARACDERKIRFAEAAVALDCAAVMQHAVHSEFSDVKKVAATVRFDTEETLATDVTDLAVSFRIASSDRISGAGPNTPSPYSKPNGSPSAWTSRPGSKAFTGASSRRP